MAHNSLLEDINNDCSYGGSPKGNPLLYFVQFCCTLVISEQLRSFNEGIELWNYHFYLSTNFKQLELFNNQHNENMVMARN
jgi:hypothetical protein